MSITFPRELPNLNDIIEAKYRQRTVVGMFEGIFSGIQKVQKHQFQRWEIDYLLRPLNRADADEWWAWLISMNGAYQTFYGVLQIPNEPKGSAASYTAPQLNGEHARGADTLSIDMAPAGVSNYLKYGDFIQLGSTSDSRLHMVLENVTTDGSGQASFDIWPDLGSGYSDNATVTVSSPKGVFRLATNINEIIQDPSNTRKGLRLSAIGVR